jgi:hypothetical protein
MVSRPVACPACRARLTDRFFRVQKTSTNTSSSAPFEPPAAHLMAAVVCLVAALTLLYPLLSGQIMFGGGSSDMFIAGYSFRLFGAETFKSTGAIPQWNPFLFGGLPYIAAMHGDIFYPTAWMRWIMPVDMAITWGMAIHFVLAGWFTYRFARALGLSWGAAIVAGVAYELSGIVASQMSPGHDGKLFVSALAPLAFWTLLRAIRHQQRWAFGAFAIVVALTVLGHYHMSYFLLIALGLWALYLAFWDSERAADSNPWLALGFSAAAVAVGVGITALQVMPFYEYIKYSPRAEGGPNTGWAFATSFALPPAEIFTAILPQFNGILDHYWGSNPLKFHTEYIGFLPLALAALALGDATHRRLVIAFSVGALLFLLFSFGGNTPFYRPFFEVLPLLNKIRAMGMVFYLVAFPVAMLAAIGCDRLLERRVSVRTVAIVAGAFGIFALLGSVGALQGFAEALSIPERAEAVQANASSLQSGAIRLLAFVGLSSALLIALAAGRVKANAAVIGLVVLLTADLWSIDRLFFTFSPRADTLFADDAVTTYLEKTKMPYRVIDGANAYDKSILMKYRIPSALGYHGFELRNYQMLGGKTEGWNNLGTPNLFDLLAIRFLILDKAQALPGFHQVVGPTQTAFGTTAVLYERDTAPNYARVILAAAKLPEDQVVPTVIDSRFPVSGALLLPDTSTAQVAPAKQPFPMSQATASVTAWAPGKMTVSIAGADATAGHLLISENWYPDWHATVDGKPGVVRRADQTLISVDLPAGAKSVELVFDSPTYAKGKIVSLVALLIAAAMMLVPMVMGRRTANA